MTGRELDLYSGLTRSRGPVSGEAHVAVEEVGPTAARPTDWIALVWQRFPEQVRARYEPRRAIGEGGMGVVVEAYDRALDRVVAVKGVRDPLALSQDERARRVHEAHLAARLTHPNILPVYDSWVDGDANPWCSMLRVPEIAGEPGGCAPTLATWLGNLGRVEDRPLSVLLGTFLQMCRAIAYAHHRGILHRDIKPENVLMGPSGEALVADWGVAIELEQVGSSAIPASIAGTPGYAAPEQLGLARASVSVRSDVFSLGVVLAELLGAPRRRSPQEPLALPHRVSRELAAIATKAAAPDPAARFADVPALIAAVEAYLSGELVEGLRYTAPERVAKWVARRPGVAVALLACTLMALLIIGAVRRENAALRFSERVKAEQLANNAQQLALMHAKAAESALGEQRRDEARMRAALAFAAAAEAPAGWKLPAKAAWNAFATRVEVSPLAWAADFGEHAFVTRFDATSRRMIVATTTPAIWEIPLDDTRKTVRREIPGGASGGDVWGAVMDQDAHWLATTSPAGTRVRLYETATGREVALPKLAQPWSVAAFSPSGDRIALMDGPNVIVYELPAWKKIGVLGPHAEDLWAIAFAPDGQHLATSERAGRLRVFAATGGAPLWTAENGSSILAMLFSADGRTFYTGGSDDKITQRDAATGAVVRALGPGLSNTLGLALSRDGRYLASGSQDGLVRIFETATGRELARLAGHTHWVWAVSFSPDGRWLASAADDCTLRVWDVAEATRPRPVGRATATIALAFGPDGQALAAAGADREVTWRTVDGHVRARIQAPGKLTSLALDALDRVTGAYATTGTTGLPSTSAAAATTGTTCPVALVRASGPGAPFVELARFDARRLRAPRQLPAVALSADGRVAAGLEPAGGVVALDLSGPGRRTTWPPPLSGPVSALALSADGARLAVADLSGAVNLLELATGRVSSLPSAKRQVFALSFSADGGALAAAGERQVGSGVTTYDLARATIVSSSDSHLAPVLIAAISRGGRYTVTGAPDGMHIERPGAGLVEALRLDDSHAGALAFSPDGWLLAWASDALVDVWDLHALEDSAARVREIQDASFFEYHPKTALLQPLPIARTRPGRFPLK